LLDALPVMVWTAGPDRRCDFFNEAWLDYRGRTLDEELETRWVGRLHPEDVPSRLEAYESNAALYCFIEIDIACAVAIRGITGFRKPEFRAFVHPRLSRHIASCIDVQRHRVSEERLRQTNDELNHQNDELQKFVSTASHDLHEPLPTIAAHCQVVTAHYDGHLNGIREPLSNSSGAASSACRP
jgi:hypothetical protein